VSQIISASGGTASRPIRLRMPAEDDEARSELLRNRMLILDDDWDDLASDWLRDNLDEEVRSAWGLPDTSVNPLAEVCQQLSTPGLYGHQPVVGHPDASAAGLIGGDGYLKRSGLWRKMKRVQYLTIGLGNYFIRLNAPSTSDELVVRMVGPANVWIDADGDKPDEPTKLGELRLRYFETEECWRYAWDVLDLGEERTGMPYRPPSYRVLAPGTIGGELEDVSNLFLEGALVGDDYPYRDSSGAPLLPYGFYRDSDSGCFWNHGHKRGATRGTLQSSLFATYCSKAALSASGKAVLAANLEPMGEVVQAPQGDRATNRMRVIRLMAGSIAYHATRQGATPWAMEIGPGAELEMLTAFTRGYRRDLAQQWGLTASDAERQHANPTSGAALYISNQEKREFSGIVQEDFRDADLRTIRVAAALLNRAGRGSFPEDGYSVQYHRIPDSPAEERDKREHDDWEVENDYASPLEVYVRRHPGTTEADAEAAILKARLDKLRLDAQFRAQAEAAGLIPAPPVPPST
jgi:hypothetical protein